MPCPFAPLASIIPALPLVPYMLAKVFKRKATEDLTAKTLASGQNTETLECDNPGSYEFVAFPQDSTPQVVRNNYQYSKAYSAPAGGFLLLTNHQELLNSELPSSIFARLRQSATFIKLQANQATIKYSS